MTIIDDIRAEKERQSKIEKTTRNFGNGASVSVWRDGEWTIILTKDGGGGQTTVSLRAHDAFDIAYALTPELGERHTRYCEARDALYELDYPEVRAQDLRIAANELDCGDCDYMGRQCPHEEEGTCGFQCAQSLHKLADALDTKAKAVAEKRAELLANEPKF